MDRAQRVPQQRTPSAAPGADGPPLRFSVLGPLRAWRGQEQLHVGSPQQRVLLAVLLLREGRTATAHELIDALWGEEPPQKALAAVRTYASRLRKALGPDALVSEAGGYALRVAPDALDIRRAENLRTESEKARTADDPVRARSLLVEALDAWSGEPLANLPGPFAQTERTRLEEWHLQLQESRLDLDLEQGAHTQAVAELTALTAAQPLRERLRELLMLALYRGGRQAEALAVYADTRRLLDDELGVDPGTGLRELQQRILQADPTLASAPKVIAEGSTATVRPAQLPASVPDFTGREDMVHELGGILAGADGRVMAVSAVAGIGGVGKTTLAVHVAHRARESFPDGQLYVDLQGTSSRPADPETVLGSFLRALGTVESAIPKSLEERAALYRSLLDSRRVLVLLDNAKDAAQVRPLLPGSASCAALVTGRMRMVDLVGAHLVDLDVLSPGEALLLFTRIVGKERVAAEREVALGVVSACGFLPLAIRIAASRLAARRTWTVKTLASKLADERRRLDELQAGDLAVKATFELGYGQLEAPQARAFRLLGLADGADISLPAAASVLDLNPEETEDLLESLVDTSLVESAAPGRYRFHDLVRLYARSCAERHEPLAEREAALSRLLDFYLATARNAYDVARPGGRLAEHGEQAARAGVTFATRAVAQDWLFSEAVPLLACVRQSKGPGTLRRAVDVLWASLDLAESGANAREYETVASSLLKAAQEQGDDRAEGRAYILLAFAYQLFGRFDETKEACLHASRLQERSGDRLAECWASNILGVIAIYQNRLGDAELWLTRAIETFRTIEDGPGEASALCNLSRVHLEDGRAESAVQLARQGSEMYDALGHTLRGANALYALSVALTASGQYEEAAERLAEALEVFRDSRQRMWEGMTMFRRAEVDLAMGRPAPAAVNAEAAITALREIGGNWRRAMVLTLLGRALRLIGQTDRSEACWRDALAIHEELGAPEAEEVRELLAAGPIETDREAAPHRSGPVHATGTG